jgi:uncharacterized protein (TIGR02466 family)
MTKPRSIPPGLAMPDENLNPMADMARNGQIENIFPTPIFWHVLKDSDALNAELSALILEKERTIASMAKSNLGGWQSPPNFFKWERPVVATLERYVRCALDVATVRVTGPPILRANFDLYGWAAVNRRGDYNTVHMHPMATWSGAYYVDPGDEAADTAEASLEFAHPIAASVMTFFPSVLPPARLLRPKVGMLILFPSYLMHSVRIYHGERARICVPFNAHLQDIGPQTEPGANVRLGDGAQ